MPKTRPYKKTGIKTRSSRKYARTYYRKYRSGKPGLKRHGGKR